MAEIIKRSICRLKKKLIILFILTFHAPLLFAQANELIRDMMMSKKAEMDRKLEVAYSQTEAGNYQIADDLYRDLLTTIKPIPSEMCFYFGKNSYYLNEHYQSIDWLSKYIELKGTAGNHFEEAKKLIELNKEDLKAQKATEGSNPNDVLSQDYTIDCGPSGKLICPVCEGETVIITKSPLGDKYETCNFCDKNGHMTCENFNRLLRGELTNDP